MNYNSLKAKGIISGIFLSLISLNLLSQPNIEWKKCLGGSSEEEAFCVKEISSGGYIIVGATWSNDGDIFLGNHSLTADCWLMKLNVSGNIVWQRFLGGTLQDEAYSVFESNDGGFIVVGYTVSNDGDISNNNGSSDFMVLKTDSSGIIQWPRCLGGSSIDRAYSICQSMDGGYVIVGNTSSNDGDVTGLHGEGDSYPDIWVVKINGIGEIQWQKCLGGSGDDRAYSIEQSSQGGYIIGGESNSTDGDISGNKGGWDYWVIKIDANGNIIWEKSYGGTDTENIRNVKMTSDAGYIISGRSNSNNLDVSGNNGSSDIWVVRTDLNGVIIWQKSLGGSLSENRSFTANINQTIDGGYILAGGPMSSDGDVDCNHSTYYHDFWIVKLNSLGVLQWQKCLGGSDSDYAHSIEPTIDNGYIDNYKGSGDLWIVKLVSETSGIENNINENPKSIFKIYDIMGRETGPIFNQILFYQYSDGSIEKKIIIE